MYGLFLFSVHFCFFFVFFVLPYGEIKVYIYVYCLLVCVGVHVSGTMVSRINIYSQLLISLIR